MDKQDLQDLKDCLELYSLSNSPFVNKGNWMVRLCVNDERNPITGRHDVYRLIEKNGVDVAKFKNESKFVKHNNRKKDGENNPLKLLADKVEDLAEIYSVVKMVHPNVNGYEDVHGKKHEIHVNDLDLPKLEDKYLPELFEESVWHGDMSKAYKDFIKLDFQRHSDNPRYFPEGVQRIEVDRAFMREIIKVCGADTSKLTEAAKTVADMSLYNLKAKDLSYGLNIFQYATNSQEYKEAKKITSCMDKENNVTR